MNIQKEQSSPIERKVIRIPFEEKLYNKISPNSTKFRQYIDGQIECFPELFPDEIKEGYILKEIYYSQKLSILIRRIETKIRSYTLHPSFVMPYLSGFTNEVEDALFLRKFEVPYYWAISHIYGRNPMYWYRLESNLRRNNIVGTTIRKKEDIPLHLAADEKHSSLLGNKVYIATTVGNECILGASVAPDTGEDALVKAYGEFKVESLKLNPNYAPQTVNTDGWQGTKNAWKRLFTSVTLILCFLHFFIKIRDRSKKKFSSLFTVVSDKLWHCYSAEDKRTFVQQIRRLNEWVHKQKLIPDFMKEVVEKLHKNLGSLKIAYEFEGCHRTSNMLDRLMQSMDRHLFNTQYFHGDLDSANQNIRGWALIYNFAPSNPYTIKKYGGFKCPADRLNKFQYHSNWLQNLLISASMGG